MTSVEQLVHEADELMNRQPRDPERARGLLVEAVRLEPDHEEAWLALTFLVDSAAEGRYCLRRVLEINPENGAAQAWLARAGHEPAVRPTWLGSEEPVETPSVPYETAEEPLPVPFNIAYDPQTQTVPLSHVLVYLGTGFACVLGGVAIMILVPLRRGLEGVLTGEGVMSLLIALVGLALGVLSLAGGLNSGRKLAGLRLQGQTVHGTILRRSHKPAWTAADGETFPEQFEVTYAYKIPGPDGKWQRLVKQQTVNKRQYEALPQGAPVTVRYLPSDQSVSRLITKA